MFDCLPSDLDEFYWRVTLNDIRVKLRLYLSVRQATFYQDFQTIARIVKQAFSGPEQKAEAPKTKEELEKAFGSMFGK